MANIDGRRVLAGCWGTLRINNKPITEVTSVDITIDYDREDIQWGIGKDSKIVSATCAGTMTVDKVRTIFAEQFDEMKKGKDIRFDLYLKIQDPDSIEGQIETFSVNGAWLNNFGLGFNKTEKGSREFSFGFNYSNSDIIDKIKF